MKRCKKEAGLLSLEASICVTIFIFLMLFLCSIFVVFEARNTMGHALLSATDSLALDAYDNDLNLDMKNDPLRIVFQAMYGSAGEQTDFVDKRLWYKAGQTDAIFQDVIKTRFLAYLTGGESKNAEKILRRYHIKDGVAGLDFSGSKSDGKDLYLSVKYTIEYEFQVFNLKGLQMEQKTCSKLWNAKRESVKREITIAPDGDEGFDRSGEFDGGGGFGGGGGAF